MFGGGAGGGGNTNKSLFSRNKGNTNSNTEEFRAARDARQRAEEEQERLRALADDDEQQQQDSTSSNNQPQRNINDSSSPQLVIRSFAQNNNTNNNAAAAGGDPVMMMTTTPVQHQQQNRQIVNATKDFSNKKVDTMQLTIHSAERGGGGTASGGAGQRSEAVNNASDLTLGSSKTPVRRERVPDGAAKSSSVLLPATMDPTTGRLEQKQQDPQQQELQQQQDEHLFNIPSALPPADHQDDTAAFEDNSNSNVVGEKMVKRDEVVNHHQQQQQPQHQDKTDDAPQPAPVSTPPAAPRVTGVHFFDASQVSNLFRSTPPLVFNAACADTTDDDWHRRAALRNRVPDPNPFPTAVADQLLDSILGRDLAAVGKERKELIDADAAAKQEMQQSQQKRGAQSSKKPTASLFVPPSQRQQQQKRLNVFVIGFFTDTVFVVEQPGRNQVSQHALQWSRSFLGKLTEELGGIVATSNGDAAGSSIMFRVIDSERATTLDARKAALSTGLTETMHRMISLPGSVERTLVIAIKDDYLPDAQIWAGRYENILNGFAERVQHHNNNNTNSSSNTFECVFSKIAVVLKMDPFVLSLGLEGSSAGNSLVQSIVSQLSAHQWRRLISVKAQVF